MTKADLPAILELQSRHIAHRIFVHSGPVHSLEQAAEERGQTPDQVVRSLLFRLAEDEFVMVLVAGSAQIPWKALRKFFGRRRLTMASKEEVLQWTGYQIGAVTPLGLPNPIPVYIDQSVILQKELSLGSGKRGTAIVLESLALLAALPEAKQVDLFAET